METKLVLLKNVVAIKNEKDLEFVSMFSRIVGHLIIDGTMLAEIDLPELEEVDQSLCIGNNKQLKNINAPKLKETGAEFEIYGNPEIKSISLPSLLSVDNFRVFDNDSLETIEIPTLEYIEDATFYVGYNPSLTNLDAKKLAYLEDFLVCDNPLLPTKMAEETRRGLKYFRVIEITGNKK